MMRYLRLVAARAVPPASTHRLWRRLMSMSDSIQVAPAVLPPVENMPAARPPALHAKLQAEQNHAARRSRRIAQLVISDGSNFRSERRHRYRSGAAIALSNPAAARAPSVPITIWHRK